MIRLLQIPASLLGLLTVALAVLLAVAGLLLMRRRTSHSVLKESNDLADSVYSMIGVLYAVLLAFVVVVVWEQFRSAEEHTLMEASAIVDLIRDARAFPPEVRDKLQKSLVDYAADVANNEWPAMKKGVPVAQESEAFERIWSRYLEFSPQTNEQIAFYTESISRLNDLATKRKLRILSSQSELPPELWILLIGGSFISVFFTYLLGTENHRVHVAVVALLSALLGFVLFLIFSLEHPYSGSLSVKPEAFHHILTMKLQGTP